MKNKQYWSVTVVNKFIQNPYLNLFILSFFIALMNTIYVEYRFISDIYKYNNHKKKKIMIKDILLYSIRHLFVHTLIIFCLTLIFSKIIYRIYSS